jgi:hypothetical protein
MQKDFLSHATVVQFASASACAYFQPPPPPSPTFGIVDLAWIATSLSRTHSPEEEEFGPSNEHLHSDSPLLMRKENLSRVFPPSALFSQKKSKPVLRVCDPGRRAKQSKPWRRISLVCTHVFIERCGGERRYKGTFTSGHGKIYFFGLLCA